MLELALRDPHFAVRTHALQLADQQLSQHAQLLQKMLALRDDPHPRVRMQLALSLGESRTKQATRSLVELAVRHGDDPWMSAAVLSATRDTADEVLEAILAIERRPNHGEALLPALASIVGARRDANKWDALWPLLAGSPFARPSRQREVFARSRARAGAGKSHTGRERQHHAGTAIAVGRPGRSGAPVGAASGRVAAITTIARDAGHVCGSESRRVGQEMPVPLRCQSLALLAAAPWETLRAVAEQLLDARQPIAIQLATVEAIGGVDHPEADVFLLAGFSSFTPKLQSGSDPYDVRP